MTVAVTKAREQKVSARADILKAMDTRWWLASELSKRVNLALPLVTEHLRLMKRDGAVEAEEIRVRGSFKAYRRATP